MSGSRVTFMGDAMAPVVQGVIEVRDLTGQPPVIVGGLAVLSRLSRPYRATVDIDVVDRLLGGAPQLEVKAGTDLLDIVRLTLVEATGRVALAQVAAVDAGVAARHRAQVDLWFAREQAQALQWVRRSGGEEVTADDLDLAAELPQDAARRP